VAFAVDNVCKKSGARHHVLQVDLPVRDENEVRHCMQYYNCQCVL